MRWRGIISVAATVALAGSAGLFAQKGEVERQNAVKLRAEQRLAEIDRQSRAVAGDISRSERSLRVARSSIAAKRKIVDELDREVVRVADELQRETASASRLDSALTRLKRDYARMVRSAWTGRMNGDAALLVLSSRDFNDASRRLAFIRRYNLARERKGAELDSLGAVVRGVVERLAARKGEITDLRAESGRVLAGLRKEQSQYESAIRTLGGDRRRLQAEAKRERDKIAAAQKAITRLMAGQVKAADAVPMTEADVALSGKFGDNKGRLPWPTGAPGLILHHFGRERGADGIESDFKGLIIAARPGSEVRAVFEGKVTFISDLGQYDKCVMVRSGDYVVGYGNITSPSVKNGETVKTGQSLGRTAVTDAAERHLVLVWMQRGSTVLDPEQWLR